MITIQQARMPEQRAAVQELFAEYLRWVCPRIYAEYRAVFDAESIIVRDIEKIDIFMPPQGLLFLAFEDRTPAGCACVRTIGSQVAELKRMYVRPAFRRQGIGRLLVTASIDAVRQQQYTLLRLDSAGFMAEAHALYHAFGFRDIQPYAGSEIPLEYQPHWVFMELSL
jgi:GNAT superfamily N-acetyltransferase